MASLKEILQEWQNNAKFRAKFNENPKQAVIDFGFSGSKEDLDQILSILKTQTEKNKLGEALDKKINK